MESKKALNSKSLLSWLQPLLPDLVIKNGKIITVDNDFNIVEAVAVKDSKIIAVGTNEQIGKFIGETTAILDLEGRTMLPGCNDAHIHLKKFGLTKSHLIIDVGFPVVNSISGIARKVKEKIETIQPGEWIQGHGWDEGYLQECLEDPARHPTREDLDPVSPFNPVCIADFADHSVWVNTKALELARISNDTPDPVGGKIVKDQNTGQPTGILIENARHLVIDIIPRWKEEQVREAIIAGMKEANSLGITSITEPGVIPEEISIYNDLFNEDRLTVRINILLKFGEFGNGNLQEMREGLANVGTHTGFGNEWLRIAGVKIFADGVPPLRTAWMYEEYTGGGNGQLVLPGKTDGDRYNELINMIAYAHKRGFQVGVHATGDRAIDACVDGFIMALKAAPWEARHYIIHTDFVTPECAKRMAEYGIGATVQPGIKWTISDYMDSIVGEERSSYQWPLRTLIDAGVILIGSSDAPIIRPDWKQGVEAAILRESKATGKASGPEQSITMEEAIRAYTVNGAWQDHMENIKGSIEIGKLADFCILDKDILTIDVHQIKEIATLMTIVGGKIVYDASGDAFR